MRMKDASQEPKPANVPLAFARALGVRRTARLRPVMRITGLTIATMNGVFALR
jgi:hypothetical protein